MERVLVIGPSGSGKSTVARELGSALGINVIHLDAVFWNPGWIETPRPQFREAVQELVKGESWIMDGSYSNTLDIRLPEADTVVFLDLPRRTCLWRVVRRRLQYRGRSRPDIAPGCPERLTWELLKWIWDYPRNQRPRTLEFLDQYAEGRRIVRLGSAQEIDNFIAEVKGAK